MGRHNRKQPSRRRSVPRPTKNGATKTGMEVLTRDLAHQGQEHQPKETQP